MYGTALAPIYITNHSMHTFPAATTHATVYGIHGRYSIVSRMYISLITCISELLARNRHEDQQEKHRILYAQ